MARTTQEDWTDEHGNYIPSRRSSDTAEHYLLDGRSLIFYTPFNHLVGGLFMYLV